jgi:hypothetical protein
LHQLSQFNIAKGVDSYCREVLWHFNIRKLNFILSKSRQYLVINKLDRIKLKNKKFKSFYYIIQLIIMKFITALVALSTFAAAHEGAHDAQGNHLDAQGNIIAFKDGSRPAYPIPPTQGGNNSSGNQGEQNKRYPLPPTQGGNNSSGNQGSNQGAHKYPTPPTQGGNNSSGNQGGNQGAHKYPLPPSQGGNQGGNNSSGNQGGNQGGHQGGNKDEGKYPTSPTQGGNNSSGNQGGQQGGNQGQKPYPTPIPNKPYGGNQASMEEFQKFLQSPLMGKFMEYMKYNQQQIKYY